MTQKNKNLLITIIVLAALILVSAVGAISYTFGKLSVEKTNSSMETETVSEENATAPNPTDIIDENTVEPKNIYTIAAYPDFSFEIPEGWTVEEIKAKDSDTFYDSGLEDEIAQIVARKNDLEVAFDFLLGPVGFPGGYSCQTKEKNEEETLYRGNRLSWTVVNNPEQPLSTFSQNEYIQLLNTALENELRAGEFGQLLLDGKSSTADEIINSAFVCESVGSSIFNTTVTDSSTNPGIFSIRINTTNFDEDIKLIVDSFNN